MIYLMIRYNIQYIIYLKIKLLTSLKTMNKKTQKMLNIQFDQQQQNQPQPILQKSNKYSIKFGNFKSQSYQMQQNILHNTQNDYVILPTKNDKNNNIKMIGQQYFNLENHTINSKTSISQHSNQTILYQLNIGNVLNKQKNQQNPQLQQLELKTQRNKKNLLNTNFEDFEDQEQKEQEKCYNKQQQQEKQEQQQGKLIIQKQQQKSEKNSQKNEIQIKEVIWSLNQSKLLFIYNRIKQGYRLKLVVQRQYSGINYFLPQFDMVYGEDIRHVISCKKQIGHKFQYNVSLDNIEFSSKNKSFIGKITGNFTNSVFQVYDVFKKSIVCTTRFKQDESSTIVTPMTYQIFMLNQNSYYSQLIGIDNKFQKGLDQLYLIPVNRKHITYYRNKKPEYCEKIKSYMLNFNGRINKGSVKNFIIEDIKSGREVLMFGKSNGQKFNLYISAPLNPFIALGIIIPHFATKIIVS